MTCGHDVTTPDNQNHIAGTRNIERNTMIKLYLILVIAPTLIALYDELYCGHI